jgi:hypothetical protein
MFKNSMFKHKGAHMKALFSLTATALALAAGLFVAPPADAAVGSSLNGVMMCSGTYYGNNQTQIWSSAPRVRAANVTNQVDHQWVYWRTRVYYFESRAPTTPQPETGWTAWTWAYAADNAYTGTYYTSDTNKQLPGSPSYVYMGSFASTTLNAPNGGVPRQVLNELYYFDGTTWSYGGQHWAAPSNSTLNTLGIGSC